MTKNILSLIFQLVILTSSIKYTYAQNVTIERNIGKDSTIALVFDVDSTYQVTLLSTHHDNKYSSVLIDFQDNCDVQQYLEKLKEICSLEKYRDSIQLDTIVIIGPFCTELAKTKLIELQCAQGNSDYKSLVVNSDLLSLYTNTIHQMGYSILNIDLYRNRFLTSNNAINRGLIRYSSSIPCENVLTSLVVRFIVECE